GRVLRHRRPTFPPTEAKTLSQRLRGTFLRRVPQGGRNSRAAAPALSSRRSNAHIVRIRAVPQAPTSSKELRIGRRRLGERRQSVAIFLEKRPWNPGFVAGHLRLQHRRVRDGLAAE